MKLPRRSVLTHALTATMAAAALRPGQALAAGAEKAERYFPPSDAQGGWRTLSDRSIVRERLGLDITRLDAAFDYCKTTSRHGGLLVVRDGYLAYERYFGRGHRLAKPNLHSIGKMFTSVCCGIMLQDYPALFPEGLATKVASRKLLPDAFPLIDPRVAEIRLGHLLTMTSGILQPRFVPRGALRPERHDAQTAIVGGHNLSVPVPYSDDPEDDPVKSQDRSALRGRMWAAPGKGYRYGRDPHIASIILRRVYGQELEQIVRERIAVPLEWGTFGWAREAPAGSTEHTRGDRGIAAHATDIVRFGYMLLNNGRWRSRSIVPASYVDLCRTPSPFNPHCPYSLQFEVNADGHVAGAPRDAFFKSGAGGTGLYMIPSLNMVIYKLSALDNDTTFDPSNTGLPREYRPDPSRDGWVPPPFNQFVDGPVEGDVGVRRLLEMVVAATAF